MHVGAAQGPGGSGPGVEGGPLAGVPDTGWLLGQVKVERNQDQDQVKVQGNQAKVKVERNQDQEQDAHLTRPHVGVGRAANHVAPLSHQLVELGVCR